MRIVIAAVGRPRNAALAAAITEYETRAARYWPLDVHEVREERASRVTATVVMQREGDRLRERIAGARIVSCDPHGKSFTSEEFSAWLLRAREAGHDTAFVVGGAYGLSQELLEESSMKLALAPWTLSHELARLVLAEQLYRAGTIIRGEPYHK